MSKSSNYTAIIEAVFLSKYASGMTQVAFESPARDQGIAGEFDEVRSFKFPNDGVKVLRKQSNQLPVADVADGDEKQSRRDALQQERVDEIDILCNNNASLSESNGVEVRIFGSISSRQIQRMHRIVTIGCQSVRQPSRQLRVDQQLHRHAVACRRFTRLRRAAKASAARMSSRSRSS